MGEVVSIEERIEQSTRAKAVERAWLVAKALENDREQFENLQWVEPQRDEERGIRRRIDFSDEFPDGVEPLLPTPLYMSVVAPASLLVPDEDIPINWTMPLLTRMTETGTLDGRVKGAIGMHDPTVRHTIDAVSFLPFPKADAPPAEQFTPEFMVALGIDADLGPGNYFAAVAQYGGKTIRQLVLTQAPRTVYVLADPKTDTHFNAKMLVNLGADELASTPDDAGVLKIFVYRITKGASYVRKLKISSEVLDLRGLDYGNLANRDSVLPFPDTSARKYIDPGSNLRREAGDPRYLKDAGGLHLVPDIDSPVQISPAEAKKEVGHVKLGEGTKGAEVDYRSMDGYGPDRSFGIQPIRIRILGVREASKDVARQALISMAQNYGK